MRELNASRREILKYTGGAVGTAGIAGSVTGAELIEVNVGYSAESGRRAARNAAAAVEREFTFDALTITATTAAAGNLAVRDDVRYVEENGTWEALDHASDETLPWGVDRIDADVVHHDGETGTGADVAIIDTGIDDDHPDLEDNVADPSVDSNHEAWEDCKGSNCNYPWSDDNDHGTHCAGIADAVDNGEGVIGVATEATLHALKVLDKNGSGTYSAVAAAIEYTADRGWDVGSMSLGGSSDSSTVRDACQYAYDEGVLLVAAAGNDGPCSDCVGYPAKYDTVVAVSATDENDDLAGFSSTGPEVELAAPGEDVYSTVIGGYDTFSGTSMACPHVAGAGAHLMANGYANDEARQQLRDAAEDLGLDDTEQGYGLLDVAAALDDSGGGGDGVAVSTDGATDVTDSSATLNGTLDDLGGADSADVSFEWGPSGDLSNATATQTLSSTGSFSEEIADLDSDTEYEFRAVAEASDGDSDTGSALRFTTDGGSAPAIDEFSLTDDSNPAWTRYDVDWSVSDDDGDLASVTSELLDSGENVLDSDSSSASGSSASGTHYVRSKSDAAEIRLTVADEAGTETSDAKRI